MVNRGPLYYYSRPPIVYGRFDVARATVRAETELTDGVFKRYAWQYDETVGIARGYIEDMNFQMAPSMPIPRGVDLFFHDPLRQPLGPRWHIDRMQIAIGYTALPTQIAVGMIDIAPIVDTYAPAARSVITIESMVRSRPDKLEECVEAALHSGTAHIIESPEPGTLLRMWPETVHRSFVPADIAQLEALPRLLAAVTL